MLRLLSDVVEGFGGNLPLLILPYVLDWIVGKEAAEELATGLQRNDYIYIMIHFKDKTKLVDYLKHGCFEAKA